MNNLDHLARRSNDTDGLVISPSEVLGYDALAEDMLLSLGITKEGRDKLWGDDGTAIRCSTVDEIMQAHGTCGIHFGDASPNKIPIAVYDFRDNSIHMIEDLELQVLWHMLVDGKPGDSMRDRYIVSGNPKQAIRRFIRASMVMYFASLCDARNHAIAYIITHITNPQVFLCKDNTEFGRHDFMLNVKNAISEKNIHDDFVTLFFKSDAEHQVRPEDMTDCVRVIEDTAYLRELHFTTMQMASDAPDSSYRPTANLLMAHQLGMCFCKDTMKSAQCEMHIIANGLQYQQTTKTTKTTNRHA